MQGFVQNYQSYNTECGMHCNVCAFVECKPVCLVGGNRPMIVNMCLIVPYNGFCYGCV